MQLLLYHIEDNLAMTDVAKKLKDASQDFEAKIKTEKDHLEGKPQQKLSYLELLHFLLELLQLRFILYLIVIVFLMH